MPANLPEAVLVAYAEGRVFHTNTGRCPDGINGPKSRTKGCPVCDALRAYGEACRGEDGRDAARYRWLAESAEVHAEKHEWQEYMGQNSKGQHIHEDRSEVFWHCTIEPILSGTVADKSQVPTLDAAIDAAMTTDAGKGEG